MEKEASVDPPFTIDHQPFPFSECAGSARELAKLVDQVRFLARTLRREALGGRLEVERGE